MPSRRDGSTGVSQLWNRLKTALDSVPRWWWWSIALGLLWLIAIDFDVAVSRWFLARRQQQPWLAFRMAVSVLGSGGIHAAVILVALIAFWLCRYGPGLRACKWLLVTLIIVGVISYGLKRAVRRPRPAHIDHVRPQFTIQWDSTRWHSFPSGDMLAATTVVWVLWVIVKRRRDFSWLALIPILVALHRLSAGRHYPSDIIASLLFAMWIRVGIEHWIKNERSSQHTPARSRPLSAGHPESHAS